MHYIRKVLLIMVLFLCLFPTLTVMAEEQTGERIYYILVDRFVNGDSSNDLEINIDDPSAYHGGDLQGIIDKIPQLSKLGITTLNLSPVMTAASYHGFDLLDAQSVDPHFGDIAELQNLVAEADDNDMNVILDFALTHVGKDHNWVNEQSDWVSEPSVNQLNEELPTVNLENEDVQQYFLETAVYWMKTAGIDGFHVYVDEQVPSSFIEELRQRIQGEKEDAFLIVDGIEDENSMDHDFQSEAVDILKQTGESLEPLLTQEMSGVHYLESALTLRFTHATVKEGFHPVTRWKLASTLLYTLPGSSFVYQGVEVPMDNGIDEPDHNMAELNKEDEEITQHLEKLATIRQDSTALKQGDMELVSQTGAMSVYKRSDQNQTMYIAINNDSETQVASLEGISEDMQLNGLLEDNIVRKQDDGTHKVILERETSNIFILEEDSGFNWIFITMIVVIIGGFIAFIVANGVKNRKMRQQA
ncbi:alpha-amylase [Gracilibacillus orientalis]|uniref:Alpha-amylase n=1 Tax=Gracilibacillus orientalis TaxID=334253 RepID=A0A1I4H7R9_9BACI|nr:alpha-amylase family glycosyl hydrolase [Gracilibacillus orientalis]SFL37810.1 alpha-amylase [Gracilibacillus orientalis]